MATPATLVSAAEYERIALAEPDRKWELHAGRLVEKPAMSRGHDWAQYRLIGELYSQLDRETYFVQGGARLKRDGARYFIPDVCVIPTSLFGPGRAEWRLLDVYTMPLPLVVEVWSPSTGDYDIDDKLPEYQRRGDQEIWRLHPFEHTLRTWRRQADGSYVEAVIRGGTISPIAFPWVSIDLDALFS